jgi:hypothetical protein
VEKKSELEAHDENGRSTNSRALLTIHKSGWNKIYEVIVIRNLREL